MTAATEPPPRIASLDVVRGFAVMGILAMNVVAFTMPFNAYMNPLAYGLEGTADSVSWLFSFIFIDGKMRGLFSFLFGASMLLVIERAEARGEPAASVHFRRMIWLLVFGLLHLYLIWFGDILHGYALIGMIAWFFRRLSNRALIRWGIGLLLVQMVVFAGLAGGALALAQAAGGDPAALSELQGLERQFGVPTAHALAGDLALYRGGYGEILSHRLSDQAIAPIKGLFLFGWETLAYFLFGMVALRSGYFRGSWSAAAYRKTVLVGFGIGVPAYAGIAFLVWRNGFSLPAQFGGVMGATVPFRPLMVAATGALIILLSRSGGAFVQRVAAAGRAAFTNYLGTSLIMTTIFYGYGLGLYGAMSRAELWLVVVAMWALMLLWSKPWLERFSYGPFEWLWRSLSRWSPQPMRKPAAAAGP